MALVKRSQALMGLSISLAISAGLALAATTHLVWLRASEPKEIKTMRAVLERLSRHNDLGDRPINFMVVSGLYAAAAAEERNLSLETEATGIGLYLVAINGVEATGWEYTVNDQRGVFAMDEAEIETAHVLRWHLA